MIYVYRLIHILAGAFWVGTALFTAFFLMPSLRAVGPAAGPVMEQIGQVRRLPLYMMGAMILTILSGIALYWRDSAGFSGPWMRSGPGITFSTGALLGIIVAVLGMAIISPATRRLGMLAASMRAAGGPPSPDAVAEMQALQARTAALTRFGSLLLLLATAAMAVARYVP
jgi:uncharacterized membrane protein